MDQKEYVQNMLTKVINPALAAHGGQAVLSGIDEKHAPRGGRAP